MSDQPSTRSDDLTDAEPGRAVRLAAYGLLIALAAGSAAGRIANVEGMQGSKDRSRWLTVRSLVERGQFIIGSREVRREGGYRNTGLVAEDGWDTDDKDYHPGHRRFVSDEAPVLPAVVAPVYAAARTAGWDLSDDPQAAIVAVLFVVSWLPLLLYLILVARLVERVGTTGWGRIFVVAAACFGTFVPAFATALGDYTAAAYACLFAVYGFTRIWLDGKTEWWRFVVTGVFAGWTFCNAFPALVFVVTIAAALFVRFPRRALPWLTLGLALPLAGFAVTNHLAYGHLHGWVSYPPLVESLWITRGGADWHAPESLELSDAPRWVYAVHYLVGHHGVLSLCPVFLLSVAGMMRRHVVARLTLCTSCFVLGLVLSAVVGPGHLVWLTPLWVVTMVWSADRMASSRWGRGAAYVALAVSALSAAYPGDPPWHHPWLYDLFVG